MNGFFRWSLVGVKEVLQNQLDLASSGNFKVEKIILTGGFGQSPSLQSYLRLYLKRQTNIRNREIELIVPENTSVIFILGIIMTASRLTIL